MTVRQVQDVVAAHFGITVEQLASTDKSRDVVYPRQVAMYLARELSDASLPRIGNEFGGRNHVHVIHAVNRITRLIAEDRSMYELVKELRRKLELADSAGSE